MLRQEVVDLRDLLRIQVAAAPADTAAALRAVPAVDEARVVVRSWVAETVEAATVPVGTAVAPRAIPVVAVLHPAIPVVVADKVGQEAGARVAVKMRAVDLAEVVVAVDPTP